VLYSAGFSIISFLLDFLFIIEKPGCVVLGRIDYHETGCIEEVFHVLQSRTLVSALVRLLLL
jgi:hypothetical protein